MKKGFGLIQVLIVLVVIAGILAISMRYLKLSVKHTADSYAREEAELFLKNSIELSLYAISGYNIAVNNNCLKSITINSPIDETGVSKFRADVKIATYYLFKGSDDFNICQASSGGVGNYNVTGIYTQESHGLVLLEVEVTSNESHPKNKNKLRLIRRTLQRI